MGPWTIEVSLKTDRPDGVILAHGGRSHGYILFLQDRIPHFAMRIGNELIDLAAQKPITDGWVRLGGIIGRDYALKLYVDAAQVGSSPRAGFITNNPNEGLQIGTDAGSLVGDYDAPCPFVGLIDHVRVWAGERTPE